MGDYLVQNHFEVHLQNSFWFKTTYQNILFRNLALAGRVAKRWEISVNFGNIPAMEVLIPAIFDFQ